ncbi:unnamed protein product [Schistocephalus solidus]|uniref:C2H2-type domain-containing protein n=1 Tax=Schistocephalus solidus TaxID=70667 RepID=A0A183TPW0_SCHSO|nr:unnamed protein product [Schistocephalus solidus]
MGATSGRGWRYYQRANLPAYDDEVIPAHTLAGVQLHLCIDRSISRAFVSSRFCRYRHALKPACALDLITHFHVSPTANPSLCSVCGVGSFSAFHLGAHATHEAP